MTDKLRHKDQFMNIIKKKRHLFQQLLKFAIVAANLNLRFRSATSRKSVDFSNFIAQSIENESKTINSQKVNLYTNDQRRSNFHTVFHYEISIKEYEMSSNVNVLMKKNKHK